MSTTFFYNLERNGLYNFGGRLLLRPVTTDDGTIISYWRNTKLARASFFNQNVVTADSHNHWLERKDPYDQVWMVEVARGMERDTLIGMTALHVDPVLHSGEYGRTYVDGRHQGRGYGTEIDYMSVVMAFEVYQLDALWLDIYTANETMIRIHDKTGWQHGQTRDTEYPGGAVLTMFYSRQEWADRRDDVMQKYDWQLPEWTP